MAIQIPVTSQVAATAVVSDHFKLSDSLQLALAQLGDGLCPLSGTVTTGPLAGRTLKSLNGEVIAGTGLHVLVRDMLAIVDGVVLSDKNKEQFNAESTQTLTVPANATSYIILRAPLVVGTDALERPDMNVGALTVESVVPAGRSGIALAKITVPNGATQVLSNMIDRSVRPYLANMNDLQSIENQIAAISSQGGSDLDALMIAAETSFKVDALIGISTLALSKGVVDVFSDAGDIDAGASSHYFFNPTQRKVLAQSGGLPASVINYWKMDEAGGPTLIDEVGVSDGLFLTPANAAAVDRVAGLVGNGLDLSAANGAERAFLGNGLVDFGAHDWSMAAWGTHDASNNYTFLMGNSVNSDGSDNGSPNGAGNGWWAIGVKNPAYGGNAAVSLIYNGAGQYAAYSPAVSGGAGTVLPDTGWHQYVVVFTASTQTFTAYLDGVLIITAVLAAPFTNSSNMPLSLGGPVQSPYTSGSQPWPGKVDEVSLWNVALNQSQVTALFTSVVPASGSFVPGVVISNAHAASVAPTKAIIYASGTSDLVYSASRDNGTTWTAVTPGVLTDISGQPSGTAMRWKVGMPANTSVLNDIALFWK